MTDFVGDTVSCARFTRDGQCILVAALNRNLMKFRFSYVNENLLRKKTRKLHRNLGKALNLHLFGIYEKPLGKKIENGDFGGK